MARPRAFEKRHVIAAAGELFWERGYQATSIGELESRTGLDRSSLYHAFGSKQALFEEAARSYVDENIDARLRGMLATGAGLDAIVEFFAGMARSFRADPVRAGWGCMVVNAIAELPPGDPFAAGDGKQYRDRFRAAFASALNGAGAKGKLAHDRITARATLLASMTMGLFLSARMDPVDAADVADAVAAEVAAWAA